MRVRLINPVTIELRQLDTAATRATGGYDDDFQEPRAELRQGSRVLDRIEKRPLRLRAQIEDETFAALHAYNAGNSPDTKLTAVLDMRDLEQLGLVDPATRLPTLDTGDRLAAIYGGACGDVLLMTIRTPPGLYAVEVRPSSIGFGGRVNLVIVRFSDRKLDQQE